MHLNDNLSLPSSSTSTTLSTSRLLLRPGRFSDLRAFHTFLSNPDVMYYWSGPPFTDIEQTRYYLSQMVRSPNNGKLDFVLVLADSGAAIGKAGIWSSADHSKGPEIGLLLNREYWGQGFMFEALMALIPQFWKEGVEKVIADVDPRNERSLGLLRKCGFVEIGREERTMETHLGWCDSVFLELTGNQGMIECIEIQRD